MVNETYQHPPATDHGTVLKPDQVAVTYDQESGYQILLPNCGEDAMLPEGAAVLVAVAMRLNDDPDFYDEMVQWFEERGT